LPPDLYSSPTLGLLAPDTWHLIPNICSPTAEELAQNSCAFFRQHAANDLNPMIHFRMVEDCQG